MAPSQHPPGRHATVFDAAAGRVTVNGLRSERLSPSRFRDTLHSSTVPLRPDEVLFKQKRAPARFEETDVYWADEKLTGQELPDSDLLKALHAYASEFYANAPNKSSKRDWRSLDETGLLALGILLEEAVAEALGKSGDLALTEAAGEDDDAQTGDRVWNGSTWVRSVVERSRKRKRDG